jgi:hypothetical protein
MHHYGLPRVGRHCELPDQPYSHFTRVPVLWATGTGV